jgi:hypothetical protein
MVTVPAKLPFLHLRLGAIWPMSKVLSALGIRLSSKVAAETLPMADWRVFEMAKAGLEEL